MDDRGGPQDPSTDDETSSLAIDTGDSGPNVRHALISTQKSTFEEDGSEDGDRAVVELHPPRSAIKMRLDALTLQTDAFMDSGPVQAVMFVATMIALFLDDFAQAFLSIEVDEYVVMTLFVVFVLFSVELLVASLAKPDYFLSFFWYLDLIAALSLIPDIPFLIEGIVELFGGSSADVEGFTVARAGRAARAGTRAGRILRLVRVFRMMRLFKLFKVVTKAMRKEKEEDIKEEEETFQPSRVGKELTEKITRKVIFMVLAMLLVLPYVDHSTPYEVRRDKVVEYGLRAMENATNWDTFDALRSEFVSLNSPSGFTIRISVMRVVNTNLGIIQECGDYGDRIGCADVGVLNSFKDPDDYLRYGEQYKIGSGTTDCEFMAAHPLEQCRACVIVSNDTCGGISDYGTCVDDYDCETYVLFDLSSDVAYAALLGMLLTVVIIFVLGLASYLFTRDANSLFIRPIERMTHIIYQLSENPLCALRIRRSGETDQETALLENAIKKISALLQIGFGEAGAEIISNNLGKTGQLNPMVAGKKVQAVFGFCIIMRFAEITECLQEDVMLFVNRIADIVHSCVAQHQGAPNKNIGEAFLLVWKLPSMPDGASKVADDALRAFLQIAKLIELDPELQNLLSTPAVRMRLPDFRARLGFGLHCGWAIEGAIGSPLKVDPSYLSPHVNMSARMESATAQFGIDLLMSQELYMMLSAEVQSKCRLLDRVKVVGSDRPVNLYTYDLVKRIQDVAGCEDQEEEMEILGGGLHLHTTSTTARFRAKHRSAVEAYVRGDWVHAKDLLEECVAERVDDQPSLTLLEFIREHDCRPPADWQGWRKLTSK
eukprot:Rmarinus@m.13196